jgi:hypothetical protein
VCHDILLLKSQMVSLRTIPMFVVGLICQSKDGSKLGQMSIRILTLILLHLEDSLRTQLELKALNAVRNSVFRIRKRESVYIDESR